MTGTVYLVGAGPGDPGLITLRGVECIRQADVVVYDRLTHPDNLRHARPEAERIYVGKQSSQHAMKQPDINALLVERALAGQTVCRLKGGDPFVFGRGGEEAEACVQAGVPFQVVPGVTSAIAGPAYAGIPVTHRDAASSFAVVTGHERDDAADTGAPGTSEARRNWARLAHAADTLVFLMGIESLPEITARLMEHGRDPATPVALVRWGTWSRQEVLTSTLAEVAEEARLRGFKAPAVTVVGEVVRLRERLRWFDSRPLFGKRIVVTRAREQASALTDLLREHGAEPLEFPVIRIQSAVTYAELDAALASARGRSAYDWVVFTSANSVKAVRDRLEALELDVRALAGARIAAIGTATGQALRDLGIRADFVPSEFVAESVVRDWPEPDMTGRRVLFPRAREARELLPEKLREMGAEVDVIPVYETVLDTAGAEELRRRIAGGDVDAVTFTSSSTVRNFVESIGTEAATALKGRVLIGSIGPITSRTATELAMPPDVEASEHTIPGLVHALEEAWKAPRTGDKRPAE